MRTFKIIITLSILIIVLSGVFLALRFHGSSDENIGKRPCDYPNTHWVSKEINSYFDVVKSDKSDSYQCKGKIQNVNGKFMEIKVVFDNSDGVEIWSGENRLLKGYVPNILTYSQFYNDKLIIKNIDYDEIFNYRYDEIVFYRTGSE